MAEQKRVNTFTIHESCSCGATFEATAPDTVAGRNRIVSAAETWRGAHKHDMPPPPPTPYYVPGYIPPSYTSPVTYTSTSGGAPSPAVGGPKEDT